MIPSMNFQKLNSIFLTVLIIFTMFVQPADTAASPLPLSTPKTINEKLALQNDLLNLLHHETSKKEVLELHFERVNQSPEELASLSLNDIFQQSIIFENEF